MVEKNSWKSLKYFSLSAEHRKSIAISPRELVGVSATIKEAGIEVLITTLFKLLLGFAVGEWILRNECRLM